MQRLVSSQPDFDLRLKELTEWQEDLDLAVGETVRQVLADIAARGDAALLAVGFGNAGRVRFRDRRAEDAARLRLHDLRKRFVINALVALKGDLVDRWEFDNAHDKRIATRLNLDRFEKTRGENPLIAVV